MRGWISSYDNDWKTPTAKRDAVLGTIGSVCLYDVYLFFSNECGPKLNDSESVEPMVVLDHGHSL